MHRPPAPCWLAALCLVCVARCRPGAALGSEVAERQAIGGQDIEAKDLPEWWVPIYSPKPASEVDGHLCGVGVRFGRGFLLAHKASINRTIYLYGGDPVHFPFSVNFFPDRVPNFFRFRPATTVDVNEPYWHSSKFFPTISDTFEPEIGLYSLDFRPFFDFRPPHKNPTPRPPYLHQVFPLETSVCLQSNKSSVSKDCRLVTYGSDLIDGKAPGPIRRLKMIGVRDLGCRGRICSMTTVRKGERAGQLCGHYANLGSPIICGKGRLEKITYLVWSLDRDDGLAKGFVRENCTRKFSAFKIAFIADELWDAHTEYMLDQTVETIHPRPSYPFITTSRRPI